MFRIAICDDDENICSLLFNMLKKIKVLNETGFETEIFYCGEDLYKFMHTSEKDFDIIFLDIQFTEKMTGIDIGNIIRNRFLKENMKIVYISSYEQYAKDLFKIRPFDFVIKPFSQNIIESIILSIIKILNQQNAPFRYKIFNTVYEIDLYRILYFRSHGRILEMMTYNNDLLNNEFYGKISEIGKALADSDFFFIHKSYLVNYHNVEQFQPNKIKLVNGKELDISRKFKKQVREMHLSKIGGGNKNAGCNFLWYYIFAE